MRFELRQTTQIIPPAVRLS